MNVHISRLGTVVLAAVVVLQLPVVDPSIWAAEDDDLLGAAIAQVDITPYKPVKMNQSLAIFELSEDLLRIERKVFEGFENVFLPLVWEDGEPMLRWHRGWQLDAVTGRFSTVVASP